MPSNQFWKELGMEMPDSQEVEEMEADNEFKPVAESLYKAYSAFIKAGFSQEQAWAFIFNQWIINLQIGSRR